MTPDRRKHRGPHPRDPELFHADQRVRLEAAVEEMSWLLSREYASRSALKLVGDRHGLTVRQRRAVLQCSCSAARRERMETTRGDRSSLQGSPVGIDGYNLLITLESALSGGVILAGRDGCYRDLAEVHGNYRQVLETIPALELIQERVRTDRPSRVDFFLDRPVSNSGRLKSLLADRIEASGEAPWNIELLDRPDQALSGYPGIVATCDRAILSRAEHWYDLAGSIIRRNLPDAWILDFRPGRRPPLPGGTPCKPS